jgi:hypothetical protein
MNTMHNELTELQDVIVQLTAELSEMHSLRDTIQQMSTQLAELRNAAILNQQSETRELRDAMNLMSTQVSSLSLAIGSHSSQPNQQSSLKYRTNKPTEFSPEFDDADFPAPIQPGHPLASQQQLQYTAKSTPTRQLSQPTHEQLKEEVMSAMYVNLRDKQRRARNIIVSGLQPTAESDRTAVCKLLCAEYRTWRTSELEEAIVCCKRIGKPQQNRVQPLLVTMDSNESAAYFISNAKQLRRSRDITVSDNVFISEDLTKAEAKAAYEIRCRRREQRTNTNQEPRSDPGLQRPTQQQLAGRGHPGSTTRLVYRSTRTAVNSDEQPSRRPASDAVSNNNADSQMLTDSPRPTATASTSQCMNSIGSSAPAGQVSRPAATGSSPTAGRHRQQ